MGVEEYLFFCARLKRVPKGEWESQVDRVMEMTDTAAVADRLIAHLSKGYKQRVGLAQALLGFPKLLILDEPTVGLDPKQILEMRTLIRQLAKDHTILLSSHILSEVQEVCDHVLIINHGKKVADGTPAQLTAMLTGASALLVTVRGEAGKAQTLLEGAVPGGRVIHLAGDGAESAFRVEPTPGSDPREAIFRACAGADLPLLDMHYDAMSLEDVFLRLTDDQPEAAEEVPDEGAQDREKGGEEE
ncbi:ABC transporter ATP-binding protein [Pseudoflavonifractor sp. AF19-9AC]|uniref:ABC transporter ATP-binding protein n=1 Tax=Pseudoflavonifractor sp. AF19-9AC TaxID=2292244 RepID=UPI00325A6122